MNKGRQYVKGRGFTRRPNPSLCGPDLASTQLRLAQPVHLLVQVKEQVRPVGQQQAACDLFVWAAKKARKQTRRPRAPRLPPTRVHQSPQTATGDGRRRHCR